jgi:hypothetical protein
MRRFLTCRNNLRRKKDRMKRLILIAVIGLACLSTQAQLQTNQPSASTDVPTFLGTVYDTVIGQGLTNLAVTGYGTYTPALKKWGGGMVLTRNIPLGHGIGTGIGVGLDYYDRQFYAVNAQVGLQATLTPFSNWGEFGKQIYVTPLTYIGLGTPFGEGSGSAKGDLETIAAVGANLHLAKVLGGSLGIIGVYGTRTGLGAASGTFYGAALDLIWKF